MCGIAGWYRRSVRPVSPADVEAQCDAILHRGPDSGGVFTDGDFGFGMRRLSILDIAGGSQPMTDAAGRHVLVFNGEIYNHPDLRAELEARGRRFRTRSDTETVLAAYLEWGDDAWPRLEGMFAVAVWDRRLRQLTLARDPLGIKPLFVSEQKGGVSFGSEIKAITALPAHDLTIDERAVHDVFRFGHVRRPRSIYREVRSLEPGTTLTIGPTGEANTTVFWRPRPTRAAPRSTGEWVEEMRARLVETTARHMQSDVPVGAFLSGGVDSSAIVAAMRQSSNAPITTFTVGHPGAAIDETAAAREVATHLGCEHVVLPLDMADAQRRLPEILRSFDEPFADMAAIPTWYASRLAAGRLKVVLCGEGGDELFSGYKRHRNARLVERARPGAAVLRPLAAAVARLPGSPSPRLSALRQHAGRAAEMMALGDGFQQFFAATQISSAPVRQAVLGTSRGDAAMPADLAGAGGSALTRFLLADLSINMPSAMLTRLDRASMAHSLEARVPLLAHTLVDWALSVPDHLKLCGLTGKYLLRRAVAPWLPPSVMRRPKQGFQVPHAAWFRGEFGRYAEDVWHDSGAAGAGYLDGSAVNRLFAEHRAGRADHARMLFAVAAFAIWWRDGRR